MRLVSPILFHILLGLKDEPQDAEGIVSRMRALGQETEPPLASFYRALKRALDDGYLEILDPEDAGRRGRPRQFPFDPPEISNGAGGSPSPIPRRRLRESTHGSISKSSVSGIGCARGSFPRSTSGRR